MLAEATQPAVVGVYRRNRQRMSELLSTPSQIPMTPAPLIVSRSIAVSAVLSRFTLLRASKPSSQVVSRAMNAPGMITRRSSSANCSSTFRASSIMVNGTDRAESAGTLGGR